jgi:NADH-quinone oxidoreductase subunit C
VKSTYLNIKDYLFIKNSINFVAIKASNLERLMKIYKLTMLITATGVDQPYKCNRFLIQYIFRDRNSNLFYFNVNTNMIVPSLTHFFSALIWLEREMFDMFGIYFSRSINNENQDLRRILTDYHFKGHPMRKDFSLIGYSEKIYSYITKTIRDKKEIIF